MLYVSWHAGAVLFIVLDEQVNQIFLGRADRPWEADIVLDHQPTKICDSKVIVVVVLRIHSSEIDGRVVCSHFGIHQGRGETDECLAKQEDKSEDLSVWNPAVVDASVVSADVGVGAAPRQKLPIGETLPAHVTKLGKQRR